jgi:hypothetical protein
MYVVGYGQRPGTFTVRNSWASTGATRRLLFPGSLSRLAAARRRLLGDQGLMLIKQREKSDCAICTIAMALGRAYEEVLDAALFGRYRPGTAGEQILGFILGLSVRLRATRRPLIPLRSHRRRCSLISSAAFL